MYQSLILWRMFDLCCITYCAWELMHCRLLNPSDSVMKSMYRQQTVTVLLKHCPKKLNQAPCTICYTAKIKHSPKYQGLIQLFLTKIIINMEFALCKRDFCPYIHFHANWFLWKTIMLWIFPTVSQYEHIRIILFVPTAIKNEQHSCKHVTVD